MMQCERERSRRNIAEIKGNPKCEWIYSIAIG